MHVQGCTDEEVAAATAAALREAEQAIIRKHSDSGGASAQERYYALAHSVGESITEQPRMLVRLHCLWARGVHAEGMLLSLRMQLIAMACVWLSSHAVVLACSCMRILPASMLVPGSSTPVARRGVPPAYCHAMCCT